MKDASPSYLKHHFLIAMPGMFDSNFARSVVYICAHSDAGSKYWMLGLAPS